MEDFYHQWDDESADCNDGDFPDADALLNMDRAEIDLALKLRNGSTAKTPSKAPLAMARATMGKENNHQPPSAAAAKKKRGRPPKTCNADGSVQETATWTTDMIRYFIEEYYVDQKSTVMHALTTFTTSHTERDAVDKLIPKCFAPSQRDSECVR